MSLAVIAVCLAGRWSNADEPVRDAKGRDAGGTANPVRLVMPTSIPVVVGVECNFYFDNIVLVARPDSVLFDTVCAKGRQQAERWTWVPTEAESVRIRSNSSCATRTIAASPPPAARSMSSRPNAARGRR